MIDWKNVLRGGVVLVLVFLIWAMIRGGGLVGVFHDPPDYTGTEIRMMAASTLPATGAEPEPAGAEPPKTFRWERGLQMVEITPAEGKVVVVWIHDTGRRIVEGNQQAPELVPWRFTLEVKDGQLEMVSREQGTITPARTVPARLDFPEPEEEPAKGE